MVWDEKCGGINHLLWYCREWRSRQDIQNHFNLSNAEAWNCCRYLKNLPYYIQMQQNQGGTKRAHLFKTRYFEIKKLRIQFDNT